jgi:hypothetical protein
MINQFVDCSDSFNVFRFENLSVALNVGETYFIQDSSDFSGCATVVNNDNSGPIYDSIGASFTLTSGCNDGMCPSIIEFTPILYSAPSGCTSTDFCFYTTLPSLSGFSGNYSEDVTYNDAPSYTGDGTTTGVIYFYSASTNSYWCLSDSLGGTCYLQGASPCYSNCPDIASNNFFSGICPTPTPTPINCSTFDFNAYFDCDWEPLPTPTPSVDCNDVDFILDTVGVTPTPTSSGNYCMNVGVSFSLSGYTPVVNVTPTPTPTPTNLPTIGVQGQVTFTMLDDTFQCVSVKVLLDCITGNEYYVNDNLIFNEIPVITGMTLFASVNNTNVCVTYVRDDSNFSSNAIVDDIFQIYTICGNCDIQPSSTPTQTPTTTPTMTPTTSVTPTITPTQTMTPTQSATPGSSPSNTPTMTPTMTPTTSVTPTITPTPSSTPNYVYVYETCSPILPNVVNTQVIQTLPHPGMTVEGGEIIKDSFGNCWSYVGRYNVDYIAPSGVITSTYQGDSFSYVNTTYTNCTTCQTPVVPTPTYKYLFESCYSLDGSGLKTQVLQTVEHPGLVAGNVIKQPGSVVGGCFTYLGSVSTSYVIPGNYNPIVYTGDYFQSTSIFDDVTIYTDCISCGSFNFDIGFIGGGFT